MNILELAILKKMVGGGGGSGTDNYNDLSNLPQINGETLAGNKAAENLGLQDALTFDSTPTEDSTNPVESGGVFNALAGKQDNLTFDGTYDASTNKAATESTVTDAINELDVSETSFDADETIDTISETDGKIAVTKKDIAIASNQVTSMTGYTKPSSAPATPAIQTNDTANQAFGKLEFKADTNQTNILLVKDATEELVDKGAKNIIDIQTPEESLLTSYTSTANGGVALTIENAAWTSYRVRFSTIINTAYVCKILVDSAPTTNVNVFIQNSSGENYTGGTINSNTTEFIREFTATETALGRLSINLNNEGTPLTNAITVRVMICTKAEYDSSPNYEAYALPNYDLTVREAEDRAALVECVDEGAKNILPNLRNLRATAYNATMSIDEKSVSVTATGDYGYGAFVYQNLKVGNYVCSCNIKSRTGSSITKIAVRSNSVMGVELGANEFTTNGKIYFSFNVTEQIDLYIMFYGAFGGIIDETSYIADEIMICTKAKYDISPNYEPPALPNTDLTVLETEDRAALAEVVDSGAKNEFEFGEFATGGQEGTTVITSGNSVAVTGASAWAKAWRTFRVKKNTTYVLSFRVTNVATVANPNYRVSLGNNHHSGGSYYGIIGCNTTGNYYMEFTPPTDADIYLVINPNYTPSAASDTPSITVDNIMVCTEADWKVSQKYVPHRPSYDLVAAFAQNGGFIDSSLGSVIANADLNSINKTTFAVYNEPANLPSGITGYCYVRTSVFDENSALQELYVIQPNPVSFFRIKLNNSWTVWVQTSNV